MLNCHLLGFQKEATHKILEHTRTGVTFKYFSDFWDAEIYKHQSKYKCEILELV